MTGFACGLLVRTGEDKCTLGVVIERQVVPSGRRVATRAEFSLRCYELPAMRIGMTVAACSARSFIPRTSCRFMAFFACNFRMLSQQRKPRSSVIEENVLPIACCMACGTALFFHQRSKAPVVPVAMAAFTRQLLEHKNEFISFHMAFPAEDSRMGAG
jgi:hypothetical protein